MACLLACSPARLLRLQNRFGAQVGSEEDAVAPCVFSVFSPSLHLSNLPPLFLSHVEASVLSALVVRNIGTGATKQ